MSDLAKAVEHLLKQGRLSSTSGGDPGMIFDEFDARVERNRKGTVTFDEDAVKALENAWVADQAKPEPRYPELPALYEQHESDLRVGQLEQALRLIKRMDGGVAKRVAQAALDGDMQIIETLTDLMERRE